MLFVKITQASGMEVLAMLGRGVLYAWNTGFAWVGDAHCYPRKNGQCHSRRCDSYG